MNTKTLHHFSSVDVLNPFSVEQTGKRKDKPEGLWLSDEKEESSWSEWAKAENWKIGKFRFEVKVDMSNILSLKTKFDVLDLTKEYGISYEFTSSWVNNSYAIDWKRIAEKYSGIVISPYQWELRLSEETNWYYTWDCASGCIWNSKAILSINLEV